MALGDIEALQYHAWCVFCLSRGGVLVVINREAIRNNADWKVICRVIFFSLNSGAVFTYPKKTWQWIFEP